MDNKLQEQGRLGEGMQKLLTNMKKDSESRKTQLYLSTRLKSLQEQWELFMVNHQLLMQEVQQEHNYIKQDYYGQVNKVYLEAVAHIEEIQQRITQEGSTSATTEVESKAVKSDIDIDIRIQRQLIKLQLIDRAIAAITADFNKVQVSMHLEYKKQTISKQWTSISDLHQEILLHEETFQNSYFLANIYEDAEQHVNEIMLQLHEQITLLSQNQDVNNHIALPRISIPFFEGKYETWTTFHDILKKIIHTNTRLGNAEKMQYLKTHLKGEATKLIQHLDASDANYNTAWQILINRYENKRLLFTKFLDNIINLPTLQSESASSLKRLHDTTVEGLRALENMGLQTSTWGPIIVHLLTKKLDPDSSKLYEQSLFQPKEI